ncbi:MAG: hypothetical protein WCD39_08665 [Methyloceanibacter sp.]
MRESGFKGLLLIIRAFEELSQLIDFLAVNLGHVWVQADRFNQCSDA